MDILIGRTSMVICFLLIVVMAAPLYASNEKVLLQEDKIKVGLLYNFLKYTEWPNSRLENKSSIEVCIFGSNPFREIIQPMQGRSVNRKKIDIRIIRTIQETEMCHLLFVNSKERERWPELLQFISRKSVLTVSDFSTFAHSGGMIEFSKKNNRIQALLNLDALTDANLRVQGNLLNLVTVVHSNTTRDEP